MSANRKTAVDENDFGSGLRKRESMSRDLDESGRGFPISSMDGTLFATRTHRVPPLPPLGGRTMLPTAKPLLGLTAGDLITPEVFTIPEDTPLRSAARELVQHHIGGAPVVDVA